jgi:hypothetical protein
VQPDKGMDAKSYAELDVDYSSVERFACAHVPLVSGQEPKRTTPAR